MLNTIQSIKYELCFMSFSDGEVFYFRENYRKSHLDWQTDGKGDILPDIQWIGKYIRQQQEKMNIYIYTF
jgi:hypothetical protein